MHFQYCSPIPSYKKMLHSQLASSLQIVARPSQRLLSYTSPAPTTEASHHDEVDGLIAAGCGCTHRFRCPDPSEHDPDPRWHARCRRTPRCPSWYVARDLHSDAIGLCLSAGLLGGKVSIVGDEVRLLDAHGNIVHSGKRGAGTPVRTPTTASTGVKPEQSGWIAYGDWYNTGDPINYFTTDWAVPDVPATNNGQTVFLFNAIEPASGDAILQPVLQYGGSAAGGGAYWAVASWFLYPGGTYYTNLVQVSTGQDLTGVMTMNGQNGTTYNYVSEFSNVDGTALQVDGAELLVWATETLEAYGITASR